MFNISIYILVGRDIIELEREKKMKKNPYQINKVLVEGNPKIISNGLHQMSWNNYNPHPKGLRTGDCVKRAITAASGHSYERVAYELQSRASYMGFSNNNIEVVYGQIIKSCGFQNYWTFPNTSFKFLGKTAYELSKVFPKGKVVIQFNRHLATLIDGVLYDSWPSAHLEAECVYLDEVAKNNFDIKGIQKALLENQPQATPTLTVRFNKNVDKGGY
jgi:hypothetical protein